MATRAAYDQNNPYEPQHRPRYEKPWYKQPWLLYVIGAAAIILIFMAATGKLNQDTDVVGNETIAKEPTVEEQLVSYVMAQRDAGMADKDIQQRLLLSGYKEDEISRAFKLSDPVVQYIKSELDKGTSRPVIVEQLLKQGHTPESIAEKFELLEGEPSGVSSVVQKYWWVGAIALVIFLIMKRQADELSEQKGPKIYTLKECLVTAEEELKDRDFAYCPTKEYKNRPDLKQYRYVFEEPIYPEFNHHKPTGNKQGNRRYYMVGVGYDKELVDFRVTQNDSELRLFLYGRPSAWESRGQNEYYHIRSRSEQPVKERPEDRPPYEGEEPYDNRYRDYRNRAGRRPYQRITPGPIEGYEGE